MIYYSSTIPFLTGRICETLGILWRQEVMTISARYMGLLLLKKRDNSKIISCAQTLVPTYAPASWKVVALLCSSVSVVAWC